jgi:hypothetical protein
MRFALCLAALALAGCANPQYHAQRASQATPAQVCEAHYYGSGEVYYAATNEMHARRLDCNQYRQEAAMLYQARTQRQQAGNAYLQNLLAPKPIQPVQPLTTNCTSYRTGNTVQTECR